jgi:hypothetical protein
MTRAYHHIQHTKQGFVLLYAVIVASLVLVISSTVYSLLSRELAISNVAKQSQSAYYAAEAALECTLFHAYDGVFDLGGTQTVRCDNQDIPVNTSASPVEFSISFSVTQTCAAVSVDTSLRKISALGYNTCSERRIKVERGIQAYY